MSRRMHLTLRLSALLLLAVATLWPRSHDLRSGCPRFVAPAHHAMTTAARLQTEDSPRVRAVKVAVETGVEGDDEEVVASDPTLTN
jgi:hypothetical protein